MSNITNEMNYSSAIKELFNKNKPIKKKKISI